MPVKLLC